MWLEPPARRWALCSVAIDDWNARRRGVDHRDYTSTGPPQPDGQVLVTDSAGEPICAGTLGHGIENLMTTSQGEIWVGYTDTGVYRKTIGRHGLVRFGGDLKPQWTLPTGDLGVITEPEAFCGNRGRAHRGPFTG